MSAITGIFRRDGKPVNTETIQKMNNTLAHRGPDGSNVWCEGPVAFGHQMLHTTPESLQEVLPFEDEASGLTITADARIDNRKELSQVLGLEDTLEVADSRYILKAYERWGENCPEKLLGDFAFAIWDGEQMFCARDHMGVKPFYYYLSDDVFTFSTEIKALFTLNEVSHKINEAMIANLFFDIMDRENTFYKDIKKHPAASKLIVNNSKTKIDVYWELSPKKELKFGKDDEYLRRYKKIFHEAVRCRMRSNFPIGSELSGGLDSSSISCFSKKFLDSEEKIETFSVVYPGLHECDESYYIQKVVNYCHTQPNYVDGQNVDPFGELERYSWLNDQPLYAHSMHTFWKLYSKAPKKSVRVILSGSEGDTTLGLDSYDYYLYDLFLNKKIRLLSRELKRISNEEGISAFKLFFYRVIGIVAPTFFKLIWRNLFGGGYHDKHRSSVQSLIKDKILLNPEVQNNIEENDSLLKNIRSFRSKHLYNLNSPFFQQSFEELDPLAAYYKTEIRYPFLDVRMLEYCLALPIEQLNMDIDRRIARIAMEDVLPPEIQWRRDKAGIDENFNLSMIKYGKKCIEDMIDKSDPIEDLFELGYLQELYEEFKSRYKKKNYDGIESDLIWRVYKTYQWLQG